MLSGSFRELVRRTISIIAPADTSHSIIYAGYGSATSNVLGSKVKLLLQTTSLVYQAIYEIKWFFYMIMNKLYYVVGLILLLLFAFDEGGSKDTSVCGQRRYPVAQGFVYVEEILQVTKRLCLLQSNNSYHIANCASQTCWITCVKQV